MPPGGCTTTGLLCRAPRLARAGLLLALPLAANATPAAPPPDAVADRDAPLLDPSDLDTTLRIRTARIVRPPEPAPSRPPIGGPDRDAARAPSLLDFDLQADALNTADLGTLALDTALLPDLAGLAGPSGERGGDSVRISFGRDTTLADGGFDALPGIDEAGGSYFGADGARFDRYNLDLEWNPAGHDAPVQWLVLGGIRAVRADIARPEDASLGLSNARGSVAIPTIGTGLRWKPSDTVVFSTTAATQTLDTGGSVVDISFSAEFRLSPLVGLSAGYEFYESSMTVENLRTTLDQEGVFAKLTIRF